MRDRLSPLPKRSRGDLFSLDGEKTPGTEALFDLAEKGWTRPGGWELQPNTTCSMGNMVPVFTGQGIHHWTNLSRAGVDSPSLPLPTQPGAFLGDALVQPKEWARYRGERVRASGVGYTGQTGWSDKCRGGGIIVRVQEATPED